MPGNEELFVKEEYFPHLYIWNHLNWIILISKSKMGGLGTLKTHWLQRFETLAALGVIHILLDSDQALVWQSCCPVPELKVTRSHNSVVIFFEWFCVFSDDQIFCFFSSLLYSDISIFRELFRQRGLRFTMYINLFNNALVLFTSD